MHKKANDNNQIIEKEREWGESLKYVDGDPESFSGSGKLQCEGHVWN